jgi:drug/metabolite transporter (DMT)-like permease
MNKVTVAILSLAAFFAAGGQLLFRVGARGRLHWQDFVNAPLLLGLLLYVCGTFIWIYALSKESLVNVYPFTALTFVLVYAGSFALMHERISSAGLAGVGFVLFGLYLMTNFNG